MTNVIVVIGAGSIGQAIARRASAGKHVLVSGIRQDNLDAAAKVLRDAGFVVSTTIVAVSSRESVHSLFEKGNSDWNHYERHTCCRSSWHAGRSGQRRCTPHGS